MPKTKKTAKPRKPKVDPKEAQEADDTLRSMVSSLNELPTDVLDQLLKNLEAIEEYNRTHKEDDPKPGDPDSK